MGFEHFVLYLGLAVQDLYGLGPGVYKTGTAPWPAHPNTMSYLTAVFRDEVNKNG